MIIKRKAISGRLGSTWIRMRGVKRDTCNNCSHVHCKVPILLNNGRTVSQLQDRCIKVSKGEVFYVLVLSSYANKI